MAYWYAHLGFLILLTSPLPIPSEPDVPVGVALMDQNPVLVEGYDAELSCRFHGAPRAVAYHKDVVGSGLLITWYNHSGLVYESGKYNITDAYSLVIPEVTAIDAGRYYCRVLDSRDIIIGNDTDATVQTAPRAPFPTIDQCLTSNESPCTLYVNHSDDAVNLTCRAAGASRGLVSLLWSHSGNSEGLQQQNRISANQDGYNETVEATIEVQNSSDPYVCTAIVHATRFENQTASVIVWVPPNATTTIEPVLPPTSPNVQTLIAVLCLLPIVVIIIIIVVYVILKTSKSLKCPIFRRPFTAVVKNPDTMEKGDVKLKTSKLLKCPIFRRPFTADAENPDTMEKGVVDQVSTPCPLSREPYTAVAENHQTMKTQGEPLSYIELWWLCKTVPDLFALAAATKKLRRQPDETRSREKRMQRTPSHRELYGALCAWKEGMEAEGKELRQRHQLYEALREQKMNKQITRLEEFRTSTEEISDDDLEHICWSVSELPERVNPVLKALGFKKQSYTDINPPAWPKPPRQQERRAAVEEDMQSLLKWRAVVRGANKMYTDENIGNSERVVFAEIHDGGESSLPLMGVHESTDGEGLNGRSNQRVSMCRALEQAGKTDPRYRQVAGTFSLHAYSEPLSYIELWWLCNKVPDLFALAAAARKLRRQPDVTHSREKRMQRTPSHRELYGALCAWKEGMEAEGKELRQRHQLYEALTEQKMNKQITRLEEFRTSTEEISDYDLEHICWNVRELPKRVKPVLKALGFKKQSYTDINPPAWPKPPRQQERRAAVEEDMQSLLKWRVVARGKHADEDIGSSEGFTFAKTYYGGEESLQLTGVKESADGEGLKGRSAASVNQRVAMCRALEQASKTDPRYRQGAKTFSLHALNDASTKRNPTEEEVKLLAIAINRRHCLKLNEKVKLSPKDCAALAKENLDVLFRSRDMLEDWLKEQMCSSYEIRCRLRAAAERAGREDIADMVIRKESIFDPSKPAQSSIDQKCSTDKTEQPVSYITLEELRWIWRLAGKEVVQKVCRRYKITAEAESTGHDKEADDDLLKELQSRLNTEYASMQTKGSSSYIKEMDPGRIVRKTLNKVHPSYASLMPKVVKQRFIFDVEITELALRIALRDICDFAEALGISIGRLTNYKVIFQQGNEGKGTFAMVFKLVEQFAKEIVKNTRKDLCRYLKDLGYRQEARMMSFGHSVGIGDMIAVAKSEDTSALLKELGVSVSGSNPDVQANPDVQSKPDFQTTVDALRGWRGAIHPPSFNHRMALVEALFRIDNKPLALGILSGKHHKVAMTREMAAQLARDIPAHDDHMSRLCEALQLKKRKGMELPSKPADAIMAWAADGKRHFLETEGKMENKFLELSNSLLRAGFFEVAYEIMAGVRNQQGGNK